MSIKVLERIAEWIDNEPLEAIRFIGSEVTLAGEFKIIGRLKKALKEKNYSTPSIEKEDPREIEQILEMIFEDEEIEPELAKKLAYWIKNSHPEYECRYLPPHLEIEDYFRVICNIQNSTNLFYYWLCSKQKKRPKHILELQNYMMKGNFHFLNKEDAKRLVKKELPELIAMDDDNSEMLKSIGTLITNEFGITVNEKSFSEKKTEFKLISFPHQTNYYNSEISLQLVAGDDANELAKAIEGLTPEMPLQKILNERFTLDSIIYYDNWHEKRYLISLFKPEAENVKLVEMCLDDLKTSNNFLKIDLTKISGTPRMQLIYKVGERNWTEIFFIRKK
jgi:hypothetical protein